MKATVYGHRFGDQVIPAPLIADAVTAVKACSIAVKRKASKAIKEAILAASQKGVAGGNNARYGL